MNSPSPGIPLDAALNGPGTSSLTATVSNQTPDWDAFLASQPQAGIFHDPRWGLVMQRAYGNRPYYLTATRAGQVVGCLQLVHQKSLLFGSHLCSLPYFDAAGIVASDVAATELLLNESRRLLQRLKAKWVELRHIQPVDDALPSRTDKITLRLSLPSTAEELWGQLKAKVRNQIRKAQQAGLLTASGGVELIDEFHAVYCRNMRDLGSPPHALRFFRWIAETFGAAVRLHVVRLGDRPVAASFTLRTGSVVCVPWAGSDWRVNDLCGNMLLYWAMLEDACRLGATCFDFGRSTRDSGTHKFKKQWGAEEVQLHWHYLLRAGVAKPQPLIVGGAFRVMTGMWRRLPVSLARRLGPSIISRVT